MDIGKTVRVKMMENDIPDIQTLAKLLGVTSRTASKLYHGKSTMMKTSTLVKLCQVLKCEPSDLIQIDSGSSLGA